MYIKCTMTMLTLELITRFTNYGDSHVVCYLIKYIVIIMNKYIIMYLFFDILLTIEGATLLHLTTNHLMRNPKQHSVCTCAYVL